MAAEPASPNKRNKQQIEEELRALEEETEAELETEPDSEEDEEAPEEDVEDLADEQAANLRRQKLEEPEVVEKAGDVAEELATELNLSEDQENRLAEKIAEKIISSKEQERDQLKKRTTQVRKRDRAPKSDHWSSRQIFGKRNA